MNRAAVCLLVGLIGFLVSAFAVLLHDARQYPIVWVDVDTGCEYIVSWSGAITPRLDYTGYQNGCRPMAVKIPGVRK